METPQSPFAVARFMLDKAIADGVSDLTPMKLLKLVYIAHGWVLCFTDKPLLSEPVEAWKYGPVVPSVYNFFKEYGSSPIPPGSRVALPDPDFDEQTKRVVESVWNAYKGFTGIQLSSMTHQPGTPWYETWNVLGGKDCRNLNIDNMRIRDHYLGLKTGR